MGWFGGRGDTRESARDAIVGLRQQLLVLEKKEEFLQKKIDDEMKKARANAASNKRCRSINPLFLRHYGMTGNSAGAGLTLCSGYCGIETKEGARE